MNERTDAEAFCKIKQSPNVCAHQVSRARHQRATDPSVLHVIPHELFRLRCRRIRRQEEHLQRIGLASHAP
jgi:hypothetical protein